MHNETTCTAYEIVKQVAQEVDEELSGMFLQLFLLNMSLQHTHKMAGFLFKKFLLLVEQNLFEESC